MSPETLHRLRAAGLDPEEMSEEQLAALESIEKPEKAHWFTKAFSYPAVVLGILALLSIFSAQWLLVVVCGIASLVLMYIGYRIQTRIATKKFLQASIRKDIETRLCRREIRVQSVTYVAGQYSQLKLLDGSTVFLETLPESLRVSKMVFRTIPTRTLWEYKLPFQIRTPTQISDTARELLDLVLKSIEPCKTLAELQQKLRSETDAILDNHLYGTDES